MNSLNQPLTYIYGIIGILLLIILIKKVLFSNRLKQFLHSRDYTETDYRTGNTKYPSISFSKLKVVIKNSNKISSKTVLTDREHWELFLNQRILSVEDKERKTIILLE